jgi:hypothetical protein
MKDPDGVVSVVALGNLKERGPRQQRGREPGEDVD